MPWDLFVFFHRSLLQLSSEERGCRVLSVNLLSMFLSSFCDRVQEFKTMKKQKEKKSKSSDNRKHLVDLRVLQKNLVFLTGLSTRLADPDVSTLSPGLGYHWNQRPSLRNNLVFRHRKMHIENHCVQLPPAQQHQWLQFLVPYFHAQKHMCYCPNTSTRSVISTRACNRTKLYKQVLGTRSFFGSTANT